MLDMRNNLCKFFHVTTLQVIHTFVDFSNHSLTARLAAKNEDGKERVGRLQKMIDELTSEKAQMLDTIERLEKAKRPLFKF